MVGIKISAYNYVFEVLNVYLLRNLEKNLMKSKVIIQIMIKNKLNETGQQCFEINFVIKKISF